MKFKVPDQVIEETTKCQNEYSCLGKERSGDRDMCEVSYADGENVLFLKSAGKVLCPYRVSFAFSQVCTCPTHFAIYQKYNQ
jgi:hypothetical protein